jgi:hypothetical protein
MTLWMSWTSWCNKVQFPLLFWAMCDDAQLCNHCVHEFLILAHTWFAFGLPPKTGCDKIEVRPWSRGGFLRQMAVDQGFSDYRYGCFPRGLGVLVGCKVWVLVVGSMKVTLSFLLVLVDTTIVASSAGEELDLVFFLGAIIGWSSKRAYWTLNTGSLHVGPSTQEHVRHKAWQNRWLTARMSCQVCPVWELSIGIYSVTRVLRPKVWSWPWLPTKFLEYTLQQSIYITMLPYSLLYRTLHPFKGPTGGAMRPTSHRVDSHVASLASLHTDSLRSNPSEKLSAPRGQCPLWLDPTRGSAASEPTNTHLEYMCLCFIFKGIWVDQPSYTFGSHVTSGRRGHFNTCV